MDLPESITDIYDGAFGYCSSLTAIDLPDGVTSICDGTFSGCSSLASITIPEGLTSIGGYAFYDCKALTSIDLSENLDSIGEAAFWNCSGLKSIYLPKEQTYIGDNTFNNCSSLTSIDLPENLTGIGSSAFYGCSGLTSIDLPESLTNIGSSAFAFCSGLTSVVLPEKLEVMGDVAFLACDALSSVAILSDSLQMSDSSFSSSLSVKEVLLLGDTYPTVVRTFPDLFLFDGTGYTLYSFSDETLPEVWSAPASTVRLTLGGLSAKMPYTGKFPDLYIEGNTSSYKMMVDESSMTFDTAPGTHTLDSFGFWLYKEGEEANKTLVTINQPITYTIDGAGIDDAAASGIGCYPGVADDVLTVSGTVSGASLRVIDMSGAQRMSVACTDGETAVDVSGLAQGMYFVLVEDGGDVAARLRFVKK